MNLKTISNMKLFIPIISIILILLSFSVLILYTNYTKINNLKKLSIQVQCSNILSDTLHSLQKERGLSSGYVSSNYTHFKGQLEEQRKKTDLLIKKLQEEPKTIQSSKCKKKIQKILILLKNLQNTRTLIDVHHLNFQQTIQVYSKTTTAIIALITEITKSSNIPSVTRNILAYINFLYYKEYTGVERALGVVLLSKKNNKKKTIIQFISYIALQKQTKKMFFQFATPEIKNFYYAMLSQKLLHSLKNFEKDIISQKNFSNTKKAQQWFQIISKKLDILDIIRNYIKKDTLHKIQFALNAAQKLYNIIIIITLIGILIFIFMLISLIRLTKNEQKLRMVMDKYIISSISDLNGRIINVSEAFCNISGYTKEELIGKNHNIVRHPDTPKEIFKTMWDNLKAGKSWSGKIKNKKKDGGFYWVYANIEPLYNEKGTIDSYISIRLDITENELLLEKIAQEEEKNKIQFEMMQQQHRLAQMGEMLSMIAHQWRQPLSAITAASGALELNIRLNQFEEEKILELTEKITYFSKHLSTTIDDFRNFFKSNKIKTKTNYQEILKSVLNIIESSLQKKDIKLNIQVKSIQYFETYENEMKQVILNLIKNAEDALTEKNIPDKTINITIDELKLTINDNAGGIPENIIEKIFDPYFSTKTKKDGTGLGLYMSKLIIEDHAKGTLDVYNNENGAVFIIDLGGNND